MFISQYIDSIPYNYLLEFYLFLFISPFPHKLRFISFRFEIFFWTDIPRSITRHLIFGLAWGRSVVGHVLFFKHSLIGCKWQNGSRLEVWTWGGGKLDFPNWMRKFDTSQQTWWVLLMLPIFYRDEYISIAV